MAGGFATQSYITLLNILVAVGLFVCVIFAVAPEAGWWIRRRKNTSVTGTWLEDVFQVSLRSPEVEEDPLAVKTFSEMLPYHCIPQW